MDSQIKHKKKERPNKQKNNIGILENKYRQQTICFVCGNILSKSVAAAKNRKEYQHKLPAKGSFN